MTGIRETFANNLKQIRRKNGLSQAELAEKVNVSTHHIAMIETGRNFPKTGLIERITDVLNIQYYELFAPPLSTHDEIDRLYREMEKNIGRIVTEAIQKAYDDNKTVKP